MKIVVCILTYKRMEGIRKALASLLHQRKDDGLFQLVKVVVVDNDANEEVLRLCRSFTPRLGVEVVYGAEPRQGISFARNAAVALAGEGCDAVAFLDDDEEACSDWLYELAAALEESGADIVTGNINSLLPPGTPVWVAKGRFFDRSSHRHLERIDYARTGNVLIRVTVFAAVGGFDPRFARTGGEDTVLFRRAHAAGKAIVWSARALVHEAVEPDRCCARWILTRAFRVAGTHVLSSALNRPLSAPRFLLRGALLLLYSLMYLPVGAAAGCHGAMKALSISATGLGMICGVFGYHHEMYKAK